MLLNLEHFRPFKDWWYFNELITFRAIGTFYDIATREFIAIQKLMRYMKEASMIYHKFFENTLFYLKFVWLDCVAKNVLQLRDQWDLACRQFSDYHSTFQRALSSALSCKVTMKKIGRKSLKQTLLMKNILLSLQTSVILNFFIIAFLFLTHLFKFACSVSLFPFTIKAFSWRQMAWSSLDESFLQMPGKSTGGSLGKFFKIWMEHLVSFHLEVT